MAIFPRLISHSRHLPDHEGTECLPRGGLLIARSTFTKTLIGLTDIFCHWIDDVIALCLRHGCWNSKLQYNRNNRWQRLCDFRKQRHSPASSPSPTLAGSLPLIAVRDPELIDTLPALGRRHKENLTPGRVAKQLSRYLVHLLANSPLHLLRQSSQLRHYTYLKNSETWRIQYQLYLSHL